MNEQTLALRYPWETPPSGSEAIEVAEGVLWMRLPLPMKLDHVNVYALDEGDSWTIVDTGFDSRKTRGIWAEIMDGPLQGKPVSRVIVTHHHPDHIGLAGWFQALPTEAPISGMALGLQPVRSRIETSHSFMPGG